MRKNLLIFFGILALLLGIGIWYFASHRTNQEKPNGTGVTVQVVPNGGVITLNGEAIKEGFHHTAPGKVHIEVSRKGFAPATQDIDVNTGETRFVGIALVPNTVQTANWYDTHPKDKVEAEGLSSQSYDDISRYNAQKQPFITDLPYVGPADEYRIDYGPDLSGKSTEQVIYITSAAQLGRDDALGWIRSQGYDPTKMTIVYKSP